MSLMYHSISLINPSKSEGWSNTVEQAKAMDKNLIISNIKVHREQRNKKTKIFDPENFVNLKKILENEYLNFRKKKIKKNKYYKKYNKKLGNNFVKIYEKNFKKLN